MSAVVATGVHWVFIQLVRAFGWSVRLAFEAAVLVIDWLEALGLAERTD